MGFEDNKEEECREQLMERGGNKPRDDEEEEIVGEVARKMSESSICPTEDDDESDFEGKIQLGPQYTLKQQWEKDEDDESLRKWKAQLLGGVDINSIGETLEPEVKILSLAIVSPDRPDIFLPIPESGKPKGLWFTLKEDSHYRLKFTFQVNNNIVSGLKYTNSVWKTGMKVYSTKDMLGTFSPQLEPYTHEMPEETTPSGFFARGAYTARTKNFVIKSPCQSDPEKSNQNVFKFLDDDNKCYLEINYSFDIRKEW